MNTTFKTITMIVLAIALFAAPQMAQAQGTALTATTLSVAVTSASADRVTLTSSTGVTAQGTQGNFTTVLYVGKELMGVKALISGTTWSVVRGYTSTRPQVYPALAPVLLGPPSGNFITTQESGEVAVGAACSTTTILTQPRIYLPSGNAYSCVVSKWMLVNGSGRPLNGAVVASAAGVVIPTGNLFHVSGTAAITGFTVPTGFAPGMSFTIIPDAIFTVTTATNVSLASTAVVNKALTYTWDGTKLNPSY